MSMPRGAAEVLKEHVVLELESVDRMYLKVTQPRLQAECGIAWFFRKHRGEAFATAKVMARMPRRFITSIERFAEDNDVPLITFERKRDQPEDDVAQASLKTFPHREGVLFIGKAREKAQAVRTVTRYNPETGCP